MFILLIIFIIMLLIIIQKNNIENYTSLDFINCRSKGYTKEFCIQTPYAYMDVNTCMCSNGELGRRLPGFHGKCICNRFYYGPNYL